MKEFVTDTNEVLLYSGEPDLKLLNDLAKGAGDLWHSGPDQGYKNAFHDIIYQTATFWWYLNDFDNVNMAISWRVNPHAFVIRKSVWEHVGGMDTSFSNRDMSGLDLGYDLLRNLGGIPLYVSGLFASENKEFKIEAADRYRFYLKHFKRHHSFYMMLRKGPFKLISEYSAFRKADKSYTRNKVKTIIPPRILQPLQGNPKVSVVIPTMRRQQFMLKLLADLSAQTYSPYQVIVVDATPPGERDEELYDNLNTVYELKIFWQQTSGSCRARNEAISHCEGDYIIFGDDDIRVPPDFVENHLRMLQTYKADACNGLDIRTKNLTDDLKNLTEYYKNRHPETLKAGAAQNFSNANSCVSTAWVKKIGGNDINYDGGYGEDSDFGLSLLKHGAIVLQNPFSMNLHLKPPAGGYRWWGEQNKAIGAERKKQPWELDIPVKGLAPKPSPTIMYHTMKFYSEDEVKEYKLKYFFLYLFKSNEGKFINRLLKFPKRLKQYKKSVFYAKNLLKLGVRHQ